jgi:hypothetical protein
MSSPPVKYLRYFDFTTFAANNPDKPLPGASVDVELNRIKATSDQTIDRLNEIQRDDGKLRDGAITTNSLADGAVTTPKLADLAVTTPKIADGAVTSAKLAPGAVTPAAIPDGSITSAKIADGGIATVDLADLSVTTPKLADNSVTGPKIAPGAVDSSKIADGSIALADLSAAVLSAFSPAVHTHPESDVVNLIADLALKAPLASPALTGIPTAPTAAVGTSTGQLATTQFVAASLSSVGSITEAPNDGALYGRQSLGWQLGVKLAGDIMTGLLQVPFLRLGGATNLFAGLKSNAAELQARLADDSGFAAFKSADHTPAANILNSLGTAVLRWLKLWAKDADLSGDLTVGGNANITGILTAGSIAPATLAAVPNRNYIHNGDFKIDQRNGYAQFTPANVSFLADRYQYFCTQAGKFNFQARNLNPVADSTKSPVSTWGSFDSAGVYVSSGNDLFGFSQYLEGYDMTEFLWGTPSAKNAVLSFYAYASVPGDYSVVIRNVSATHSFLVKYNIPAAGQFYKIVIPIPGPTVGTWLLGNVAAASVTWTLDGAGTSLTAPTGAWAAAVLNGAIGQTKMLSTAGAGFAITAIKLELGNVATPFVPLPMEAAIAQCQRYYWADSVTINHAAVLDGGAAEYCMAFVHFPVAMRAAPSVFFISVGQFSYSNSANAATNFTPAGGTPDILCNTLNGHVRLNAISNPQGAANIYKNGYWTFRVGISADP